MFRDRGRYGYVVGSYQGGSFGVGICCLKLDDLLLEARMSEITPELLCQVSPAYWAQFNEIKLQGGVFSFVDHEYQPEPMQSQERRIC